MTEYSREAVSFSPLPRRQVVTDFNGGRLTSDAGVLLLREVVRRSGLSEAISGCPPDPRNPIYVVHGQRQMLAQRIFALAAGYEDLNDHQTLRDDPVHGQQDGRFYHGYCRHYCFLPLYVFCGGHQLCALLRPANIDPAKYSGAIVKLLVDRIRREWPQVRIIVRGDSGFCRCTQAPTAASW